MKTNRKGRAQAGQTSRQYFSGDTVLLRRHQPKPSKVPEPVKGEDAGEDVLGYDS